MKKIIFISVLVLIMTMLLPKNSSQKSENGKMYEYVQSEQQNLFTNHYAGYSYEVPDGFKVNTDYASLRVKLESEAVTIDIYNETQAHPDSYINYTNEAVTGSADIEVLEMSKTSHKGRVVEKMLWERRKLSRLENDKNHYLKFDIRDNGGVYTILVKSAEEISDSGSYLKRFDFTSKGEFTEEQIRRSQKKIVSQKKNWSEETQAAYDEFFGKSDSLKWGIFSPEYSSNRPGLEEYEQKIDFRFGTVLHYSEIKAEYIDRHVGEFLQKAYGDGRIVELTLQPPFNADSKNMMYDVLDGKYDDFLRDYSKAVGDFGHPVLLRLYNEMNGDWCEYSSYQMSVDTDLFCELYNYTAGFFEDLDNVIFVWNANGRSFPDFDWNNMLMHLPDSKYIDVIGLTMYNTGNYYPGETWKTFNELYRGLYDELSEISDLPMMITEFACARSGGNKEEWVRNMFDEIKGYPNIRIAIWWNMADRDIDGNIARAYYIDDSEEMIEIFKDNMKTE